MPITICDDLIKCLGLSNQWPNPRNIQFIIMQDQESGSFFTFEPGTITFLLDLVFCRSTNRCSSRLKTLIVHTGTSLEGQKIC